MDYSFAEFGYVDTHVDSNGVDVDGDGFALRGSLAVNPNFFVFAGYQDLTSTSTSTLSLLEVGGGGHWPLSDKIDLIGKVGIVKAEIDAGPFDDDDDGFLLARACAAWWRRSSSWKAASTTAISMRPATRPRSCSKAGISSSSNLAGGLSVSIGDDVTSLGLNVRMTF